MRDTRSRELARLMKRAGGVAFLSRFLNTSPMNLYGFINRGDISAKYAPLIEQHTKGEVRCESLNREVEWEIVRETARQDFLLKLIKVVTSDDVDDSGNEEWQV